MLTNLFSMFDPTMLVYNPMYLMIFFLFFVSVSVFNAMYNKFFIMKIMLSNIFWSQFSNDFLMLCNKNVKKNGNLKLFLSVMYIIFMFNFSSLMPSIFSVTSHLSFNFSFSLTFWLTSLILALKISWTNFLSHLTPLSTPVALMSFMVLIETISNIIRPITLSVRLMANMVAGHLLLYLLSKLSLSSILNNFFTFPLMLTLTILELGVCFIQSYVITLLLILYYKEVF